MKKILIDTNIYSNAMRGDHEITGMLKKMEKIGISVISIGELLSGFKGGTSESKNRKELDFFLDSPRVVLYPLDIVTSEYYSEIINSLKKAGTPVPTNDIWIAAIAFQHGLKLFTRDAHFSYVKGLMMV
ncbi:MAG: type II toxin-antitoxin system VapC family toxin [Desulfobacteraceae bacterium]|nr:type II toxin-antitoxin system VapC family toxin [Desulfobacteraceae bacterium]